MLCKTTVALLGNTLGLVVCTDDSADISGRFKLSNWNLSPVFPQLISKKKNLED